MQKPPYRKVVKHRQFQAHNSGTDRSRDGVYRCTTGLTLDCGHEIFRKGSVPIPKSARCYYCRDKEPEQPDYSTPGISIPHADPSPIAGQYKEQLQDRADRVAVTGGREDY